MQSREVFLADLLEKLTLMLEQIEEQELIDDDLTSIREYTEQLKQEVELLCE